MNLDIRIFVNVVTTILDYFVNNVEKSSKCDDLRDLGLKIMKEDDFSLIYVTNFDCIAGNFEDVLASFFNELSPRIDIHSYFETITVLVKVARDEEWAHDLRCLENRAYQIFRRRLDAKEAQLFAHMEKYQCFKLKCTLPSKDVSSFMESISKHIKVLKNLHNSNPNAKYAFRNIHLAEKNICDARVEPTTTMVACKMMSSAMMKIIGRSRNDEFRKKCLTLLGVSDTRQTGEAIMRKLTSLVPANSLQKSKKENKVSTASRNDQARTSAIFNRENNKVNKEYNSANQETKRVTERSSNTNSEQGRTNGKENNRADAVDLAIIVSSRGRRVKKTKFCDEMHNA